MFRLRAAAFLAVVFALTAIPSSGQTRNSSAPRSFAVRGSVRIDETGMPMEMVRVYLRRISGETLGTSITNSNGDFEFLQVPNGSYQIVADVKGYEPVRESLDIENSNRQGILVFLRKPVELQPAEGNKDPVSTHELALPAKAQEDHRKGAERLYDKNDPKGSIKLFERAIAEAPGYYEAYFDMGIAYTHMKQTDDAEAAFHKSVELSEDRYSQADVALAALYTNSGRFADAISPARRGVELSDSSWQAHYELGRALCGLGQWDEAEKTALDARRINVDFGPVYLLLSNIHIHKKNYSALKTDLETYLKIEPNGEAADQARSTLEQLREAMEKAKQPEAPAKRP